MPLSFIWYLFGNWKIHWSSLKTARDSLKGVSTKIPSTRGIWSIWLNSSWIWRKVKVLLKLRWKIALERGLTATIASYSHTPQVNLDVLNWKFYVIFIWQEFIQQLRMKNQLKKLKCSIIFYALPWQQHTLLFFSWSYRTPSSDIIFSIWERIHFICLFHLGLYLLENVSTNDK